MSPRIRHIVNVGDRSGRLTVVEVTDKRDKFGKLLFRCKCDCGNETMVPRGDWCTGIRKSCGCIQREAVVKHEMSGSRNLDYNKLHSRIHNGKTMEEAVAELCA